jgi:hypothetical protein
VGNGDLGQMKLRALYVDHEHWQGFLPPLKFPRRVRSAILAITQSAIRDAGTLRDYVRRARTDDLAEEIIALIEKQYGLQELLENLRAEQSETTPGIPRSDGD